MTTATRTAPGADLAIGVWQLFIMTDDCSGECIAASDPIDDFDALVDRALAHTAPGRPAIFGSGGYLFDLRGDAHDCRELFFVTE